MVTDDRINVQWFFQGKPDYQFGVGATSAERALGIAGMVLGVALYGYFHATSAYPWADWQYALGAFFGLDVAGGAVAFSLNSCKRFYHSPTLEDDSPLTRILKRHWVMALLHPHPILVAVLYPNGVPWAGVIWYLTLIASILLLAALPLYLRRPAALGLVTLALLANQYFLPATPGFEWLIPALFLKLVYGQGVREEPYRPAHG